MTTMVEETFESVTAGEILAGFARERSAYSDEITYGYTHLETGRIFNVRRSKSEPRKRRFFLCEMVPNGRMAEYSDQGELSRAWDEPRITDTEARVGPNGLREALRTMGIDVEVLVLWGGGYCVDSIYHECLGACAESVAVALNRNFRYRNPPVGLEAEHR